MVIKLDTLGFAVSAASACHTLSLENGSYVIESLGKKECSNSSLRITLGRSTKKSDLDKLPKINNSVDSGNWDIFVGRYDILKLCDKSAIACVKRYFDLDAELTKKTIEYANTQKMRNPSAYLVAALNEKWIKLADEFSKRVNLWQNIYAGLSFEQKRKIDNVVSNSVTRLVDKWSPEPIDSNIVRLIYARYIDINDSDIVLRELVGSRYQTYFMRDRGLFDML